MHGLECRLGLRSVFSFDKFVLPVARVAEWQTLRT